MILLALGVSLVGSGLVGFLSYQVGWRRGRDFAARIAVQTFNDVVGGAIARWPGASRWAATARKNSN